MEVAEVVTVDATPAVMVEPVPGADAPAAAVETDYEGLDPADNRGQRKRKGHPVKVRVAGRCEGSDDDQDKVDDCRCGGAGAVLQRSEGDFTTLKRDFDELQRRYDSLIAIVGNDRDSKTAARERIRMVVAKSSVNDDDEEEEEVSEQEVERDAGGVVEEMKSTEAVVTEKAGSDTEVKRVAPVVRRVTRSETRRRGRPPKAPTIKSARPAPSTTTITRRRTNTRKCAPPPPPPPPRKRRAMAQPSPTQPPTQQQEALDDDDNDEDEEQHRQHRQHQLHRKQRKDKGQRRSSLQPKERRRLWRQNRPLNKCEYCQYESRDKTCFRNHVAGHDPGARRRYVCEICSKSFRCKRGIQNHRLSHDAPERLHRCAHCSFTTPHKLNWVQHLAVIHKVDLSGNPVAESIQCAQCSFTCVANHQLKAHVLRKHTLDKPFKCEQCDYSTVIRHELETHVGIRHKNERRYMCDLCGFRSQTQGGLTRHKRTHTGSKPFKCHICGYCYADSGKLKSHLLRHSSDEKPYVCHVCGHASRRRDNLRMHLKRIHGTNLEAIRGHRRFQQHTSLLQLQQLPEDGDHHHLDPSQQQHELPDDDEDGEMDDEEDKVVVALNEHDHHHQYVQLHQHHIHEVVGHSPLTESEHGPPPHAVALQLLDAAGSVTRHSLA